jgi:hypothetical protein
MAMIIASSEPIKANNKIRRTNKTIFAGIDIRMNPWRKEDSSNDIVYLLESKNSKSLALPR